MTGGGFDLTKLKKKSSNDFSSIDDTSSANPMSSQHLHKKLRKWKDSRNFKKQANHFYQT